MPSIPRAKLVLSIVAAAALLAGCGARRARPIGVARLLREMVDLENLARLPRPFFKQASASSYSRESHKGGEAWFDNRDVGQYVRTETVAGRTEQVLADLRGPGAVTRFWSANPVRANVTRFYFDGEETPRLALALKDLFAGETAPFGPDFSYISGSGGNLYYPLPYARSLKITIEENEKPVRLYYEIGYRSYEAGIAVETFDPRRSGEWSGIQAEVARRLSDPAVVAQGDAAWTRSVVTVGPGETKGLLAIRGEKAVAAWSARVLGTKDEGGWDDPRRPHNALRSLLLEIAFDGERSVATPLGDFFGSAPGVNPYRNLFFTVDVSGRMTSRLPMPFRSSMEMSLTNVGREPYAVEVEVLAGPRRFGRDGVHLRAQWGSQTRDTWPFFDVNVLAAEGEGKVVGTVYEIANPVLIWWGEGDQKVSVDGEGFPSTFGTGTEDDYGYAYGDNRPFTRPYHAQTRVDGPLSGGHISLNRWYVLDALPFRTGIRFDQEMWHWMPCRPTWAQVVYWYARPGGTGPREVDRAALRPVDLGVREAMLEPLEGEDLRHEQTGGTAAKERLANCSGAEHLVWRGGRVGARMTVHLPVPRAGRYAIDLNLGQSPDYGRVRLLVNGTPAGEYDGYSERLFWIHPRIGEFDLPAGDAILTVEALAPNPAAKLGANLGLDYVLLTRTR